MLQHMRVDSVTFLLIPHKTGAYLQVSLVSEPTYRLVWIVVSKLNRGYYTSDHVLLTLLNMMRNSVK